MVLNPHFYFFLFSCNCLGMEGERPARLNRAEADRDTYRRSAAPRKYTDELGFWMFIFLPTAGSNYLSPSISWRWQKSRGRCWSCHRVPVRKYSYLALKGLKIISENVTIWPAFYPHCREVDLGVAEDSSLSKFYSSCTIKKRTFCSLVCLVGSYSVQQLLKIRGKKTYEV